MVYYKLIDKNMEKQVPYIVHLKDGFCLNNTTIKREFCGFLVNNEGTNFYFELNGSRMLVVIPYNEIKWMAPSKTHYDLYFQKVGE